MAQQQPRNRFTDDQLRAIARDPDFTSADLEHFTPQERERFIRLQSSSPPGTRLVRGAAEHAIGAAKGLGSSMVGLADIATSMSPLGLSDSMQGRQDPLREAASALGIDLDEALSPVGDNQQRGFDVEQFAEFFSPLGRSAQLGTIKNLVKMIPNSASAETVKTLNKAASMAGRSLGEAGHAGVVATAQGDDDPLTSAAWGAAGPVLGPAIGRTLKFGANTGDELMEYLLALGGMKAAGGAGAGGVASRIGAFGLAKKGARKIIDAINELYESPSRRKMSGELERLVGQGVGRTGAYAVSDTEPLNRRRLGATMK